MTRILPTIATLVCLAGCASTPSSVVRETPSRDGTQIEYSVHGSAEPTLVLVHGWSCDRSYWDEQIAAFRDDYTVITVDLAGHGGSGTARQAWTIEQFGNDVAAVVRAEGRTGITIVGHSMGGAVVLAAARKLGTAVTHIVGVDTLQVPTHGESFGTAAELWTPFATDFRQKVAGVVRAKFFRPDADPALVDRIADDMSAAPPTIAIGAGIGLATYDTEEALIATRDVPLTLLNAKLQPTDPLAYEKIDRQVAITLFPETGHFPMLEDPDAFNTALRAALRRVAN
ncbi:MAG: alpha/beta fold hydrolase [Gammaproteobacteria bacterium]